MTLEEKLTSRISWDAMSDGKLALQIEQIVASLRKKCRPTSPLWNKSITQNCYAACLAWNRMRKVLPRNHVDMLELKTGLEQHICREVGRWEELCRPSDALHPGDGEHECGGQPLSVCKSSYKQAENVLLAALFLDRMVNVDCFFWVYSVSSASMRALIKRIEHSDRIAQMCIRLMNAAFLGRGKSSKHVQLAICNRYVFRGTQYAEDPYLCSLCTNAVQRGRVMDLHNVLKLFPDFPMLRVCHRSKKDFFEMAKSFTSPHLGIMFYYDLLKSEGWSGQALLDEVGELCTFSGCPSDHALNDYLHLCWCLQEFPADAERILREAVLPKLPENISASERTMAIFINVTFYALLKQCPGQLLTFIKKMGQANPFLYREDRPFKKNHVWYDSAGRYLSTFQKSIPELIGIYDKQDMIDLYMNSPMKSLVDFHYLIKRLFDQAFRNTANSHFIALGTYLGEYRFTGHFLHAHHNYRVSVSSVHSTYQFPVYITWSTDHADYISKNLPPDAIVSFRISHGDNRQGMIFAVDVRKESSHKKRATDQDED